jgi:glutamate-ammonia-ligase adenylyltransferase
VKSVSKTSAWSKAIHSSADPQRAQKFFDLLAEINPASQVWKSNSAAQLKILASLFSGSQALGNLLVAHPGWLDCIAIERLEFPRREQGLRAEVNDWLEPLLESKNYSGALSRLREFKQREMLRIAARDLARLGNVSKITRDISDVADVCLGAVLEICSRQFTARFGEPWQRDANGNWRRTEFCILGMGKLGGQELNYSSDVDVLFVYSDEGNVFKEPPAKNKTPRAVMANHSFFNRLAEAFIAEVSRMAPEGMLFRIDLRLRPEGDSGPLCRSSGSYENYYAQWGQTWERMMLLKARGIAGSRNLAGEFLEMIQPFRYPRSIGGDALQEIRAMKNRIEHEVLQAGGLERNVKLGRGGIREIEFIAQSQQLLRGGKLPFLQGSQTLPTLEKLAQYNLLPESEARALASAYCFLRDVEHRLQMDENLQTHTIPESASARERLAKLMGFKTFREFDAARRTHSDAVRNIFDKTLGAEKTGAARETFPREFNGAESHWKKILAEHSFRDPEKGLAVLREFVEGPGYIHVSPRTIELARKLLTNFFAHCPNSKTGLAAEKNQVLSDPDRVVTRLDNFITAYGARAVLFELWNSNPGIFELLLLLFDRSEFLAELAIRTPDLVDDLVTSGRLRRQKSAAETLRDLRHGIADADQKLWLRRYHQAELMRIGLRDILGLADPEQYLAELSALADACLQYAVEIATRKHKFKSPPFVVIGLGKLGGAEIDYGSDLDIIFVADANAGNLRKTQRVAVDVMDLLSSRTEMGLVFHTDARLRPDGEKGLLVNTLGAYEEYYRQRAQLWEIQSLTRTRPIAGDLQLGEKFQQLAAGLTNFKNPDEPPSAFSRDWKEKIHAMRMRIEKERTQSGKDELAIKTGKGGMVDAEFIAQTLCLENGWNHANTMRALEHGRETGALPDAEKLIQSYRQLRRVEGILRRWSYEGETVLPDEPEPFYRVSVRCGFSSPREFRVTLAAWRKNIREVYNKVFST